VAKQFERLTTKKTTPRELQAVLRDVRLPAARVELASSRGQLLELGRREWAFVLTREAVDGWDRLGSEPVTVAVLAQRYAASESARVERVLVALPAGRGKLRMEMNDAEGRLLWTGAGSLVRNELQFSMAITRPGTALKGIMAGRIRRNGQLVITQSRLPKPVGKKAPKLESED
jgi:hypothetical protein